MAIEMNQLMENKLDEFFAKKTIQDVDRNTYQVLVLDDNINKITITLIFMREWNVLEPSEYSQVVVNNCGVVFTFPAYWQSVPKNIAIPYFKYIIQNFYDEHVSAWVGSGDINGGTGYPGSSGNNPLPYPPGTTGGCPCNVV